MILPEYCLYWVFKTFWLTSPSSFITLINSTCWQNSFHELSYNYDGHTCYKSLRIFCVSSQGIIVTYTISFIFPGYTCKGQHINLLSETNFPVLRGSSRSETHTPPHCTFTQRPIGDASRIILLQEQDLLRVLHHAIEIHKEEASYVNGLQDLLLHLCVVVFVYPTTDTPFS